MLNIGVCSLMHWIDSSGLDIQLMTVTKTKALIAVT